MKTPPPLSLTTFRTTSTLTTIFLMALPSAVQKGVNEIVIF
jgi:hypothetical protein